MYKDKDFQQDSGEKSQCSHESLIMEKMFPRELYDEQGAKQALEEHFLPSKHSRYLIDACFRCHNFHKRQFYNKFRQKKYAEIKEPCLSSIYVTEYFISMEEIGKWIEEPEKLPYPGFATKVPKQLNKILESIQQYFGYFPSLERFLLFYPVYLEKHLNLYQKLLIDGQEQVYFIGFCAAAEMGSAYMMGRMIGQFLETGGDMMWITNGTYPDKLRKIIQVIRIIGRCPWQLDQEMMNEMQEEQDLGKLIHFLLVIVFVQRMSTISLAVGLQPEQHFEYFQKMQKLKKQYDMIKYQTSKNKPHLFESVDQESPLLEEQLNKTRQYMKEINVQLTEQKLCKEIMEVFNNILPKYEVIEKRLEHKYEKIDYSEYNFSSNVYPILESVLGEIGRQVYDLLKYSQTMTFNNFGKGEKDTREFRKAMRYYSENLCGYTHLQYDYKKNVKQNKKVSLPLKFYIRLLTLCPILIKQQVIDEINHQPNQPIQCFDLGHVAALISDTKMNVCLLMITRALE